MAFLEGFAGVKRIYFSNLSCNSYSVRILAAFAYCMFGFAALFSCNTMSFKISLNASVFGQFQTQTSSFKEFCPLKDTLCLFL